MSHSIQPTHSSRFLEHLEQGKSESAFKRAEALLLQSDIDHEELRQVCTHLDDLLAQISSEQQEIIFQLLLKAFQSLPVFSDEQAEVLTLYGELFLSKGDSLSAMRCFAIANVLAPSNRASQKLMVPMLPFIYAGLETQLQKAAGLGNPTLFLQLLTQFSEKFGFDVSTIQQIYQIADRVYGAIRNPNTKGVFTHLLDQIEDGIEGRLPPQAQSLSYKQRLLEIRKGFESEIETRLYQNERAQDFRNFFGDLFRDAFFILGEPPCGYEIRVMGSLAREEVCPYSDLEYLILIEDEKHFLHFQKLAQIFDLQILSLGETDPKHQEFFIFGQIYGLEIDHQANPAYHESLIGQPERVFALPQAHSPDELKSYKSRLQSVPLVSNRVFEDPQPAMDVRVLLEMRREEFLSLRIMQSTICDVKKEFVEPLFHLIGDLGLFYGVPERNTLDTIDSLPIFNEITKRLLKFSISILYSIRINLHLVHQRLIETTALPPTNTSTLSVDEIKAYLSRTTLSIGDYKKLRIIHTLVLFPLYHLDFDNREVDLIETALREPTAEKVEFTAHFLQEVSFEEHQRYYQMLNSPTKVDLQRIYLDQVPNYAEALAKIPNRAGYRLSRQFEEEALQHSLENITTIDPSSGVKIRSPLIGDRYLKIEAAKSLLDESGHIKKRYRDSLHRVNCFKNLHFKEMPYQPLMEYAIHSLNHRIMGKASPTTTLARFETSENLVYPVLISETIEGEKLTYRTKLDEEHLTWLRLCEILTKPGDGRLSNYVVQGDKIYCIDNDISFTAPVQKSLFQNKVSFCSLLFTLDIPLHPGVLASFCALEPDALLKDWLEEMETQEATYLNLFPDLEERKRWYESKTESFTPTLPLNRGAIVTLSTQFHFLQSALKQEVFKDPMHLLQKLIHFQRNHSDPQDPFVEEKYKNSLKLPFPRRLREATSSQDQSLTSTQAMKLQFSKRPTFAQIQPGGDYSLKQAYAELCLLEAHKLWVRYIEGDVIHIDFASIPDIEREELMIRSLQFLLNSMTTKPTSLTLKHSRLLNTELLEPLLHSDIHLLDFSYGDRITSKVLTLIEVKCPLLSALHLRGCSNLQSYTHRFPNLRALHLDDSPQLSRVRIASPLLQELHIENCENLRAQEYFDLAVQFAEGEIVTHSPAIAEELWRKASHLGHTIAIEILEIIDFIEYGKYPGYFIPWSTKNNRRNSLTSSFKFESKQIEALGHFLKINTTLTELYFCANRMKDLGAQILTKALRFNKTVTTLGLMLVIRSPQED